MATGTGLDGQLGIGAESAYGTPVTVDRFYEFDSEAIQDDIAKIYGRAIGTGRFQRADRVKTYVRGASGDITLPVMAKGFGLIFEHMLGDHSVAGEGDDKTHTIVPDEDALKGLSLTVQVGRPSIDGTVRAFTYEGGKITSWELSAALDEIVNQKLSFDFETLKTDTALASLSLPSENFFFTFVDGSLTIGESAATVRNVTLTGDNGLATGRRFLGNTKREPIANAEAPITGNLEAEFEDMAVHAAWLAGTAAELELTFDSGVEIGETGENYSLTVTIPAIEYTGSTPQVGGPDIVMQPRPFKALDNGSDPIITIAYVTDDTAA